MDDTRAEAIIVGLYVVVIMIIIINHVYLLSVHVHKKAPRRVDELHFITYTSSGYETGFRLLLLLFLAAAGIRKVEKKKKNDMTG